MKISYREDGTITGAYNDDVVIEGGFVQVPDDKLKEDFLSTFALGKYRVVDGEVKAVRGFRSHRNRELENILGLSSADQGNS